MVRQRVRIRFRKEGDLRLIGHLDLMRALERLFRRAGLPLGMSEGFHPKPRMSFPMALSVGIAGLDEVMELELSQPLAAAEVLAALTAQQPPGLTFTSVVEMPDGAKRPQVARVWCEASFPAERRSDVAERAGQLLASTTHVVRRQDDKPVDVRPYVEALEVDQTVVRMRLKVTPQGAVRPREVLAALGLDDIEREGLDIVRTKVELADELSATDDARRPMAMERETP